MKSAFAGQLDALVILAGDGDFKDLIEFVTQTLNKKVYVFGILLTCHFLSLRKLHPGVCSILITHGTTFQYLWIR